MKRVLPFFIALTLIAGLAIVPFVATANSTPAPDLSSVAQGGPTATPNDPNWLGFAVARDALSEKVNQRITLVKQYRWAQTEFIKGMAVGCTEDFPEGVEPPTVYFGWRYVITLLNNKAYEIRVSFDLKDVLICDEVTEDVGGDTETTNPGGIGTVATGPLEVGAQIYGLGASETTYLKQAKMKWIKIQVKEGDDATGIITNAHANGFKVLLSVLGNVSQVTTPAYQDTFAAYVGGLAAAGADAIEVWNEPNIDREWPAGQISGASYVELLKKANAAIKAKNANTIVITGAPAPTGFFGAAGCSAAGCNDDTFYKQMAAAGAAAHADCIGVHYNEGVVSPKVSSGDPRDNYPTRYFQTNLNRAMSPFPGMVACITEIGYLSPDGWGTLPASFAWGANTSIAEQAQWLGEAVVLGSQLGNVRLMIIFNLNFTVFGADPQAGYAMVRKDGSCLACTTLAGVQN